MSILDILFNIFIAPLELFIESVYVLASLVFSNPGVCIVVVSLVVNFLCLPLYKRADAVQEAEREKQQSMQHWVDHIKATFKGDERYMILSEYYRQQNYKPWHVLKSSVSLLMQIPFFIAAFHYLSNLGALSGAAFLFLPNLGVPDGLLIIGGLSINIMPFIMTGINIIAGIIYTRGLSAKYKIQLYAIAAIFLVLLYNSPSGLVLYWTLNNLFSLGKNIVMKLRKDSVERAESSKAAKAATPAESAKAARAFVMDAKTTNRFFLLGVLAGVLVGGLCIPLLTIASSPVEFVGTNNTPAILVAHTFTTFLGAGFWVAVFYALATQRARKYFAITMWVLVVIALIDFLVFGNNRGVVTANLAYSTAPTFATSTMLVNVVIVAVAAALTVAFIVRLPRASNAISSAVVISLVAASVVGAYRVADGLQSAGVDGAEKSTRIAAEDIDPVIPLSKGRQNVVVIMMDRAMGEFIPFFVNEKPEMKDVYSGFTFYSNTLSYGFFTNLAAPALFGGYEYTPAAMNARSNELLQKKHDEALLTLPRLFAENGYQSVVCDPPYAGYQQKADLSIYDDYENINAYKTIGKYQSRYSDEVQKPYDQKQKNNFVFWSLFRGAPVLVQSIMYQDGNYLASQKALVSDDFMQNYSVLENLDRLTSFDDGDMGTFLCLQNSMTHEPALLSAEYLPSSNANNCTGRTITDDKGNKRVLQTETQVQFYQTNMASFIELGEWLEYLKKNGVYDNTRIIIVADHGSCPGIFERVELNGGSSEWCNPLLLVKDFGASGELVESTEFMTNADVPLLASQGLDFAAVNPFTGVAFADSCNKLTERQLVTTSYHWQVNEYNGTTFDTSDGTWYSVTGNIFNKDNWELVGEG